MSVSATALREERLPRDSRLRRTRCRPRQDGGVTAEDEIREIVDRETRAWSTQDVELLLSVFHPDMVWPWPPDANAHDPVNWTWGMGRFDATRWRSVYAELFATYQLVHNRRELLRLSMSAEGDGAFAVVDVDTQWQSKSDGSPFLWKGRACKVYARVGGEWKMTMHTGLLAYPLARSAQATDAADR